MARPPSFGRRDVLIDTEPDDGAYQQTGEVRGGRSVYRWYAGKLAMSPLK